MKGRLMRIIDWFHFQNYIAENYYITGAFDKDKMKQMWREGSSYDDIRKWYSCELEVRRYERIRYDPPRDQRGRFVSYTSKSKLTCSCGKHHN